MRKNYLKNLALLGCLSLSQTLLFHPSASHAQTKPAVESSPEVNRLNQMFSPDIQKILNVCLEQGFVNIGAGADQDGSVICSNGSRNASVQFTEYVNTFSDFMAAAFLVGFRTAYKNDTKLTPQQKQERLAFFATPGGKTLVQQLLQQYIAQTGLVPKNSTQSLTTLVNNVMQRSLPVLENSNQLETLLGTSNQYNVVVENFCTSPGMSVRQAKTLVPELSSIQLYSICIQESGIAEQAANTSQ